MVSWDFPSLMVLYILSLFVQHLFCFLAIKPGKRCGDVVAHWQRSRLLVSGSNPASLTVKNSEDWESHCVNCKISGQ